MKTLIIVILILLSVLTMPLSLKKALDRRRSGATNQEMDTGAQPGKLNRPDHGKGLKGSADGMAWLKNKEEREILMKKRAITLVIPQWQGGGDDLSTYEGAYAMLENYLDGQADAVAQISRDPIGPIKEGILGYDDILRSMRSVNDILRDKQPAKIFTVGGGCDADTPCAAWLNQVYDGDLAVVYIDSHGDLNTPESSESHLYYGMSLRALAGESAREIVDELPSVISPKQLFTCGMRNLDPEEIRYKGRYAVDDFTVEEAEKSPQSISTAIRAKGFHNIYIHIDLDVLDPKEFTLTPIPEPGGMTKAGLLRLLSEIAKAGEIAGFGILEYSGGKEDRDDPFLQELIGFAKDHVMA